jgi:hypothetical protein
MKLREYEITISPTGEVEIHVDGFKGKGCLDAIKMFEEIVGHTRDLKPTVGYYEPDETVELQNRQEH